MEVMDSLELRLEMEEEEVMAEILSLEEMLAMEGQAEMEEMLSSAAMLVMEDQAGMEEMPSMEECLGRKGPGVSGMASSSLLDPILDNG